jgi:hypothetical protein
MHQHGGPESCFGGYCHHHPFAGCYAVCRADSDVAPIHFVGPTWIQGTPLTYPEVMALMAANSSTPLSKYYYLRNTAVKHYTADFSSFFTGAVCSCSVSNAPAFRTRLAFLFCHTYVNLEVACCCAQRLTLPSIRKARQQMTSSASPETSSTRNVIAVVICSRHLRLHDSQRIPVMFYRLSP